MLLSREQVATYAPVGDHATHLTSFSWPSSICYGSKSPSLSYYHKQAVASKEELASTREPISQSGFHARERIVRVWAPSNTALCSTESVYYSSVLSGASNEALCFSTAHILMSLSLEPVAKILPEECQASAQTLSSWESMA